MRCNVCGAPMSAGQKICEHCGSPVSGGSQKTTSSQTISQKDFPKEKQWKETRKAFNEIKNAAGSGAMESMVALTGAFGPMAAAMTALSLVMKIFEPVIKIVSKVMDVFLGQLTAGFMKALMPAIKPLIPLIMKLAPLFEIIGYVLGWVVRIGLLPFIMAIWGIGSAIAFVVDFITSVLSFFTAGFIQATNWLGTWNAMMLPVIGGIITGGEFAEGGTVPGAMGSPMMIKAHGGETVHEPSMDADILDELKAINRYNQWNYNRKRSQW